MSHSTRLAAANPGGRGASAWFHIACALPPDGPAAPRELWLRASGGPADTGLAKIVVKNMRLAETGCVQNRSETFSDGLE
jgi:hypothetical protein